MPFLLKGFRYLMDILSFPFRCTSSRVQREDCINNSRPKGSPAFSPFVQNERDNSLDTREYIIKVNSESETMEKRRKSKRKINYPNEANAMKSRSAAFGGG